MINLGSPSSGPSASFSSFDGNGNLNSCFSFLNQNNFNQWYTQTTGTNTVLVSRYIYKVASINNLQTSDPTPASELNNLKSSFNTANAKATGDKLCYASASNVTIVLSSSAQVLDPSLHSGSFGSVSSYIGSSTSSQTQSLRVALIAKTLQKTSGHAGPSTRLSKWPRKSSSPSCLE